MYFVLFTNLLLALAGKRSPGILFEIIIFGSIGLTIFIVGWLAHFCGFGKKENKPKDEQKQ